MKKILALCLIFCMLPGLLAGCEDESAYVPTGDALYSEGNTQPTVTTPADVEQQLCMVYDPTESMHPYQTVSYTNRLLFPLIYQGLFSVDADYRVIPILCSAYSMSRDMKTYTFYLEEATFSDGTPLTADDVVGSLNAARNSPVYKGRLTYVRDVSVAEDGAVVVSLSTAYENFLLLLDIPILKVSELDAQYPMGTGPYYLEERAGDLRLLRRTDWWCNANLSTTAQMISLVEASGNAEIRDAFEFGNVSLVCADPGSDLYVDFRSDYELWSCETGIFLYLACHEASPVFSNQTLRQALTHAIDRNALVEAYYRGFATATTLPTSPNSPNYHRGLASRYDYDEEAFQAALDEAQMQGKTVTILVNKADSRRVRVARDIAKMLSNYGLRATTSELSGKDYTNALNWGNYDLYLGQTMLSPNMDLSAFYSSRGALNYGGMADAAILAVCQEALANAGNFYTLHQMVMEDAMLCPILFRSYAIYTARGVFPELHPARDNVFCYDLGKTLEDILIA